MKKPFPKLVKHLSTLQHLDAFITLLFERIANDNPITSRPMIDGLCIGWLSKNRMFMIDLLHDKDAGRMLDGTMQQIEQVFIWIHNNEDALVEIAKQVVLESAKNYYIVNGKKIFYETSNNS